MHIIAPSPEEWDNLKSKILISSWGGSRKTPSAFTEKGLYMLATILKSPTATQTTVAIVETFAKIREFAKIVTQLPDIKEEPELLRYKASFTQYSQLYCKVLGDTDH